MACFVLSSFRWLEWFVLINLASGGCDGLSCLILLEVVGLVCLV